MGAQLYFNTITVTMNNDTYSEEHGYHDSIIVQPMVS